MSADVFDPLAAGLGESQPTPRPASGGGLASGQISAELFGQLLNALGVETQEQRAASTERLRGEVSGLLQLGVDPTTVRSPDEIKSRLGEEEFAAIQARMKSEPFKVRAQQFRTNLDMLKGIDLVLTAADLDPRQLVGQLGAASPGPAATQSLQEAGREPVSRERATPEEIAGRRSNLSPGLVQIREGPEAAAIQARVFEQLQESKRNAERIAANAADRAAAERNANERAKLTATVRLLEEMMSGGAIHPDGKRVTAGEITKMVDLWTSKKPIPKKFQDIIFISPTGGGVDASSAQQYRALGALHDLTSEQNNVAKAVKNKEISTIEEARSQLGPTHEGMIDLGLLAFNKNPAAAMPFLESRMQFAVDTGFARTNIEFLTVKEMIASKQLDEAQAAQNMINQLWEDRFAAVGQGVAAGEGDAIDQILKRIRGEVTEPEQEEGTKEALTLGGGEFGGRGAGGSFGPPGSSTLTHSARAKERIRREREARKTPGPGFGRISPVTPRP